MFLNHISKKTSLTTAKENFWSVLNPLRKDNLDKLILAYLNISSIENKLDYLSQQTIGNADILLVWKPKLMIAFGKVNSL